MLATVPDTGPVILYSSSALALLSSPSTVEKGAVGGAGLIVAEQVTGHPSRQSGTAPLIVMLPEVVVLVNEAIVDVPLVLLVVNGLIVVVPVIEEV